MEGGQGKVETVLFNGHRCACKRLLKGVDADDDSMHRFLREIVITQKLNSCNVIRVLDYGEDEDGLYYIMPFYQGNLRQFIDRSSSVVFNDPVLQKTIFSSILNGVKDLHMAGIIHRDLKPENVLMNSIDEIVICDFGFSKDVNSSSSYTATGDWFGTPKYMSPEQLADSKHVDVRTDIYALGEILNDLSGRVIGMTPNQLCRIADKAKAYEKDERYNSVTELIDDATTGYNIWIRNNNGVTISTLIDEIARGSINELELISNVELILQNRYYKLGDADNLSAALNEKQYHIVEDSNDELCLIMFEHIWEDWYNAWDGKFNKIDDMTSLVSWYWKISKSSTVKGYNLAKLAELAKEGRRYAAMEAMADMISEIATDEDIKKSLLRYVSTYTIKDNYKKIGRICPSWI